ncbi:MAG: phage tail tape measure protein [Syntrophaceae bacterium]|nr:phage tail tape measure protein [Syntrophaceae bacterium]
MRDSIKLILSGDSHRLDRELNRTGKNIGGFGNRAVAVFSRVGRTMQRVSDRVMTPFAGIASGAAIAMAGKGVIDFDSRLARLAIQAGLTRKETLALKKELLDASRKTYQLPTELLAGMEQIIEKTGNLELAKDTVIDMGVAASATGAEMAAIGAVTSNLNEKLSISKKEMRGAFDILNQQGKAGAFTLRELAMLGERLFAAAAGFGVKGTEGLRKFGAFVQIARRGTGSSEMATTAVERTMADLIQNAKKIRAVTGFSIFDEAASRKEGRAVMKDIDVVLKEIIKRTRGDEVKLNRIFGQESIRAVRAMALSYRELGDFRVFDSFIQQGGDGVQMMTDFSRWTETAAAKMILFRAELTKLANENLAGPIELFTKALDVLNRHPVITKGGLLALLGVAFGPKIYRVFKGIFDMFRGRSGKGDIPGVPGLPGLGKTPIPVYVVNNPSRFGYGGGTKAPAGGGTPTAGKTIGGLFKRGPGGLFGAGKGWKMLSTGLTIGSAGLGTTALAATAAGAGGYAFGTVANWGINQIVSRLTGGMNDTFGGWLYDVLHKPERTEVKNDIAISLAIDEFGRLSASTTDMNTHIALPRGKF